MAVYKLFPSQDATLYTAYPAMNTGLDAILEVKNEVTSSGKSPQVARSIIKFDQSEINNVVDNQITGSLNISSSLLVRSISLPIAKTFATKTPSSYPFGLKLTLVCLGNSDLSESNTICSLPLPISKQLIFTA